MVDFGFVKEALIFFGPIADPVKVIVLMLSRLLYCNTEMNEGMSVFFRGMTPSAEQTNHVNRTAVLSQFVCSTL